MASSILIVDDEARLAEVLAVGLEGRGFETAFVCSAEAAIGHMATQRVDLVLTDLRMPGLSGQELLRRLRTEHPLLPVVVMTAYASVRDAVELVKEGAFDYVAKPFDLDEVVTTIQRALHVQQVESENQRLRQELEGRYDFSNLVGHSPVFQQALQQIAEVCGSRATVLLQGPSGTGKELFARAVHYNSDRRKRGFVAVNCAAIPETLLESELFGHVKGAFTGAIANRDGRFTMAHQGTLFLDEIGDMPLAIQAKLLRAIQEQCFEPVGSARTVKVDVRIVAATHRDLRRAVEAGQFREDLFYRLNVFPIHVPPLNQRTGDVPLLAQRFLQQHAASMGKRIAGFSPAALAAMESYDWPGNVRELQNCVERAVIVARGEIIDLPDLPRYLFEARVPPATATRLPGDLDAELFRLEREMVLEALRQSGGVQARAAERLGISERSFWHRMKKLEIRIDRHLRDDRAESGG
ncbi:sigma-54 dependent transcriptional regulator (plasmid) [Roseomonas gilardii subsp. gilardii]|uniref:sigma-54-dependent transcriptional regulator n=1 Tax=Roseomonas gilardii TaxID=257708 RepID=UPI001FFB7BBE|nr:sigma-54 dependent transcriptional regulator [Roseomonas gilardii]UPG74560.1 sigma-54 dependent transcriptional regulator [Roseomonas gilardii subsp. gilardii]